MLSFKLIPRFTYTYRFADIFLSLFGSKKGEKIISGYFKNSNLLYLNSGRAGLFLILKSLAKGKNLRVGVQIYNCKTVFRAIELAGCTPVFFDINDKFSIDPAEVEKRKDQIDVLIVTHTFGMPADVVCFKKIMSEKFVIEDCCHAFMSEYKGEPCGTMGDAGFFSMGYGKFPSIGHGGFVTINNNTFKQEIQTDYDLLKRATIFGEIAECFKNLIYSIGFKPVIYGLITYPFFKRLDRKFDFIGKETFLVKKCFKVNRNVLTGNVSRYFRINKDRKWKANLVLSDLCKKQDSLLIEGNNFYIFPYLSENRDNLIEDLLKSGIECGKHFSKSIEWAEENNYTRGSLPNSERIVDLITTIPLHPAINRSRLVKIGESLNKYE